MIGRVVSTKMNKTAVVLVEMQKKHPLYGKIYLRTKKYLVDDQIGVSDGDIVEFVQIRPISRLKNWQIKKVVGQDLVAIGTENLKSSAKEAIAEVLPEEVEEAPEVKEEEKETVEAEVKVEMKTKKTDKKIKGEAK